MKRANLISLIAQMMASGVPQPDAEYRASVWANQSNAIFFPKKHPIMSYSAQNRAAKKRRNKAKMYANR